MIKFNKLFRNLYTKALNIGVVMMFGLGIVNGQTDLSLAGSVFSQNFDNATGTAFSTLTPPFTSQDNNAGNTWRVFTTVGTTTPVNIARGGSGACAGYPFSATLPADDWMFSSALTMKAGQNYRFSHFYATLTNANGPYPEKLRMYVGRAAGAAPTSADMLAATTGQLIKDYGAFSNTDYLADNINFTVPTDGTYYIAWYAYSDRDQFILRIDDVSVTNVTPVPNDISITSITTTATPSNCGSFTATTPFSIKVKNTGINAQSNFPVNFSATRNGTALAAIASQNVTSLAPDAEITLTVNLDLTLGGTYILTATSALTGDGNTNNNTRTGTSFNPFADLTAQGTFSSNNFLSFTSVGWSTNPVPTGDSGWFFVNIGSVAVPDGAVLGARPAAAASNDWVISNCMRLQQNQKYRISYQRRAFNNSNPIIASTTPEKLKMFVGNTNMPASMTTQILPLGQTVAGDETFTNAAFQTITYEYTHAAVTGTYYIGWQQTSDAAPTGFPTTTADVGILLDNFSIVAMPNIDMTMDRRVPFPTNFNTCGGFTNATPIEIKAWNSGTQPVTSISAKYRVRDIANARRGANMPSTTYITPATAISFSTFPIAPNEFISLNFNLNAIQLPNGGTGFYLVDVYFEGDGLAVNDTLRFSIFNPYSDLTAPGSIYTEGFEDSFDLLSNKGWTSIDSNSDTDLWTSRFAGVARTGTGFAICPRSDVNNSNDWLISNCMKLNAGSLYRISYYRRSVNGSTTAGLSEKMKTYWGTSNTVAAMTNQIGTEETFSNATYTLVTFDFTPTTTGTHYFGFQQTSDFVAAAATAIIGIAIDDFTVLAVPPFDVETVSITTTANPTVCGSFTATTSFTVTANNVGTTTTITNNTFTFTITRNGTPITVTGTSSINSLAIGTPGTFIMTADLTLPGIYVVTATSTRSGDPNTTNDTQTFTITRPIQDLTVNLSSYSTSFEGTSLATSGWTTQATGGWGLGSNPTFASQGTNYPFVRSSTTAVSNSWLYSPCFTMVAGKIYTLDFKYRTNTNTEKLVAMLVTSNTATTGTTIKDYPALLSNGAYSSETGITFLAPANGTYYIAYQLYSAIATTAGIVLIDELKVTNTGLAPAAPAQPTAGIATPSPLQVDLSWTASVTSGIEAATSYRIEFATTSTGTYTLLANVNAPAVVYSHINAIGGQAYFYRIFAVNVYGTSAFATATATAGILAAPTSLTIGAQTTGNALNLTWTASPTATGYSVERGIIPAGGGASTYSVIGTSTTTNYTDTGLTEGAFYRYKVRASKGTPIQYSDYSNVATSAAVLALEQNSFSKQIVVSPNPNEGNFKVNMTNVKPNRVTFIMTDMTGKEVHRSTGDNEDTFNFNMSGVSKGIYLLYINTDKGQGVKRVVIK